RHAERLIDLGSEGRTAVSAVPADTHNADNRRDLTRSSIQFSYPISAPLRNEVVACGIETKILRSGQHRECAHPVIPDKAARLGSGRAWRHVPYPGIELDSQEHAASRGKEKTRRSVEFGQQRRIAVAVEPRERSGAGLDDPAAEVHDTYGGAPAIADQQIISSDHQPAWVADHCRSGWASISAVTLNAVSRESVDGSRGIDYPYTVVHGIGDEQVAA